MEQSATWEKQRVRDRDRHGIKERFLLTVRNSRPQGKDVMFHRNTMHREIQRARQRSRRAMLETPCSYLSDGKLDGASDAKRVKQ